MKTVAWVNFTSADNRGPQKRFVEYVKNLHEVADEQLKIIAIFPFYKKDTRIYETFDNYQVEYYDCGITRYAHLFSPNQEVRKKAYQTFIQNVDRMVSILKQTNCSVVVSNCTLTFEVPIAAKILGISHITFIRGIFYPADVPDNVLSLPLIRNMEELFVKLSDLVVTQSQFTAKLWKIPSRNVDSMIIPVASELEEKWEPLDEKELDEMNVLILGGAESCKNQELVVDVAKELKQRGQKVNFHIYGNHLDALYKAKIEQKIAQWSLQDSVQLYPYEKDVDKLYKQHAIIFISSTIETFGVVATEAMARYRPVISTLCGGPEESIVDGKTGYLVSGLDIQAIADAFCKLLEDKKLLVQMGIKGRKRWEEKYKASVVMNQWNNILLEQSKIKREKMEKQYLLEIVKTNLEVENLFEKNIHAKISKGTKWLLVTKNMNSASVLVGWVNTLTNLKERGKADFEVVNYKQSRDYLEWADNVVFFRVMDESMIPVLDEAKNLGKKTLYYVDDSLYEIPSFARGSKNYHSKEAKDTLDYFLKQVDSIVACSPWLADSYKQKYGYNVTWLQPAIKPNIILSPSEEKHIITIGFAGNVDYEFLLEPMKDVFIQLYNKYKGKIQFEFLGPQLSFLEEIDAVRFAPLEYAYYEILLIRRRWDIGLACTNNTPFMNKKYYNKYLEYSRFGIAGIYSDCELFRRIIQDGTNGLLAKDRIEDWYQKIEQLIVDDRLRKQIAKNAYEHAMNTFSIKEAVRQMKNKLKDYM